MQGWSVFLEKKGKMQDIRPRVSNLVPGPPVPWTLKGRDIENAVQCTTVQCLGICGSDMLGTNFKWFVLQPKFAITLDKQIGNVV